MSIEYKCDYCNRQMVNEKERMKITYPVEHPLMVIDTTVHIHRECFDALFQTECKEKIKEVL